MYVPPVVGVPLIVIVLEVKFAFNPGGKSIGVPIPVAPVVVMVILDGRATPEQTEGLEDGAPAVLFEFIVTAALPSAPQQPSEDRALK